MNLIYKAKSSTTILLLLSALTFSAQSSGDGLHCDSPKCAKRTYLRADIGGSILGTGKLNEKAYNKRFRPTMRYSAGIGYIITPKFRSDFTASYNGKYVYSSPSIKQPASFSTFMINGYYDLVDAPFIPYLTAGAGVVVKKLGNYTTKADGSYLLGKTTTSIAWQVGAGLRRKIHDALEIDLGYKFINPRTAETTSVDVNTSAANIYEPADGGSVQNRMKSHNVTVGILYKF